MHVNEGNTYRYQWRDPNLSEYSTPNNSHVCGRNKATALGNGGTQEGYWYTQRVLLCIEIEKGTHSINRSSGQDFARVHELNNKTVSPKNKKRKFAIQQIQY